MDVLAVHWQSHQPLLHKMMGESQTQGFPFLQTIYRMVPGFGQEKKCPFITK